MMPDLQINPKNNGLYTDKYFLRAKIIAEAEGINPIVRYQVFARKDSVVKGMKEAVSYIKGMVGDKAAIYALRDGDKYQGGESLMKLEGRFQDLVDLETVYLGILAHGLTGKSPGMDKIRKNAYDVVKAANGKPVIYFGARHYHPSDDEKIAGTCKEEGFVGCSTDIGARAWGAEGVGTIPHASMIALLAYMIENGIEGKNVTAEAARLFDKYVDPKYPRIQLIDTFNKEIDDSIATANAVPKLSQVRIDTCGENYAQGARDVDIRLPQINVSEKYLSGTGVSIPAVWALRRGLDEAGYKDLGLLVSSGFNAEKIRAFNEAETFFQEKYGKQLFDTIATGSLEEAVMTTSDICAYFSEKQGLWVPLSKVGRKEKPSDRLVRV